LSVKNKSSSITFAPVIKKSLLKFKKALEFVLLVSTNIGVTSPVNGLYSAIASTLVPQTNHIIVSFSLSTTEPIHLAPEILTLDFTTFPYAFCAEPASLDSENEVLISHQDLCSSYQHGTHFLIPAYVSVLFA